MIGMRIGYGWLDGMARMRVNLSRGRRLHGVTGVRIVWNSGGWRRRLLLGRGRHDMTGVRIRSRSLGLCVFFRFSFLRVLFGLSPMSGVRISGRRGLVATMAG